VANGLFGRHFGVVDNDVYTSFVIVLQQVGHEALKRGHVHHCCGYRRWEFGQVGQ
jgi:hypothetical protein